MLGVLVAFLQVQSSCQRELRQKHDCADQLPVFDVKRDCELAFSPFVLWSNLTVQVSATDDEICFEVEFASKPTTVTLKGITREHSLSNSSSDRTGGCDGNDDILMVLRGFARIGISFEGTKYLYVSSPSADHVLGWQVLCV